MANTAARADCTPAAANNVTATCTGGTVNQGGGAPGTSTGANGYGTGFETGVTVNVSNASVSGTPVGSAGIYLGSGTVNNSAGSLIIGEHFGVITGFGDLTVTNDGVIQSLTQLAIGGSVNTTVTNNASGVIIGGYNGIGSSGTVTVANYGSIAGNGALGSGVSGGTVNVTNYAGGGINGGASGVGSGGGGAVNVVNNAGANIVGGFFGVDGDVVAKVTNSGTVSGAFDGIMSGAGKVDVINNAGGVIDGGAGISALGAGGGSSIFNAGTITGTLGTAIRFTGGGNTLTIAPGSVINGTVQGAGADTLQLGGSGTATFDATQIGAAAQYQGFSAFNKVDDSIWTLTGTATFPGQVNVNHGTLIVSGDISSASATTVNAGGFLAGTGTLGTTQVNAGGILAPGDGTPASSMTVAGNLAFQSGAIYLVQLNPAAASFTKVAGTATLGGAGVSAVFADGSYVAKRYTILTAAGGVSGTFAPDVVNTNLPATFRTSLSYDATDAYLDLSLAIPSSGLNGNQQAVGNALVDFFNRNGGIALVYGTMTAAGLTQASGEAATGSQQTTFQAMSQFMGLLTDPFMDRGNGTGGTSPATGYAEETPRHVAGARDAFAMFTKAAAPFVRRWSVWASGFGGSQSTDGNAVAGSNDTTSRIYGTAVGADYLISPNTIAGFALAGGGTNFTVNTLGSGRSDLFQAGAYLRHNVGAAYLSAAAAYGWQDITTDRRVAIAGLDQLRAEFNANAWSGRLESGYRFAAPWSGGIGLTPYAAGQFTSFQLPAYAEQVVAGGAAFALAYGAKSVTDARSELGLRGDKSFATANGIFTLRGRAAWAHDFNPDRAIAATFQALPGASFVVNGAAQASESALTTASAEWKWINGWSAAASFEGEFSNVTRSYAGKGVVRYAW